MDSINTQERVALALRQSLIVNDLASVAMANRAVKPAHRWGGVLSWDDADSPENERVLAVLDCEEGIPVPYEWEEAEPSWAAVVAQVSQALGFAIEINPVGWTHAEVLRAVEGPDPEWSALWSRPQTLAGPCPF